MDLKKNGVRRRIKTFSQENTAPPLAGRLLGLVATIPWLFQGAPSLPRFVCHNWVLTCPSLAAGNSSSNSRNKKSRLRPKNYRHSSYSRSHRPPLVEFLTPTTCSSHNIVCFSIRCSQLHFYRQLKRRGQPPLHREWIGAVAEPGEAVTSNNADTEQFLSAAVAGFLG